MEPLAEVASTLPVTVPMEVKAGFPVPKFAGFTISAPKSLPIQTLAPVGSKRNELGETGRGFPLPAEVLVETKYAEVLHVEGGSCAHPALDASTAGDDVDPVTMPETAAIGERSNGAFGGLTNTGDA